MKKDLGQQATKLDQLLIAPLVKKRSMEDVVIIHHVINGLYETQLEIERRCPINGIAFERVVL